MNAVREDLEAEARLHAELNVESLRALRLAWLSRLAVASVPVWLQCLWHPLPDLLEWLAVVAVGFCLAMSAGYAALENRWTRRSARTEPAPPTLHAIWTPLDEVRSALWWGLALVCLVPWIYVTFHRSLPPRLLSDLTASAATVFVLLVLAETAARIPLNR